MMTRSPKIRQLFALCAFTFTAGCGDDEPGKADADATDTRDGGDTVILPDTIQTEVEETVEDVQAEVIVPGEFGAPCNNNGDCDSGYCVDGPKGFLCTRTCDTTCPAGYDCKAVSGGTDVVFLCLPRLKENCQPCAQNFQCAGGACLQIDGQGRCAYDCADDEDCPEGFACDQTDQVAGRTLCQPTTGSCSCYAGADGGLRSCTVPSDLGICVGVSECSPETGWGECSAGEPVPEECNGKDDDCDGVWDDNLAGAGQSCVNRVEGVGECQGIQICLGVAGWLCVGPSPSVEECNAIDDDCDGDADEDFKDDSGAYSTEDNCGGCGVTCAGKIPNATALCSNAGSTPRCEVDTCEPGYYQAGPLTCLPIADFSCVPCLTDAHCTTPGDRCLELDGGNFCGRDCATGNAHGTPAGDCPAGYSCEDLAASEGAGVRQCVPDSGSCTCLAGDEGEQRPCTRQTDDLTCFGTETCDPDDGWSVCTAKTPVAETCNNADDNCNAVVDDVVGRFDACNITNTFGTCPGALDCRTGAALTCVGQTPATEACNGLDDDCNGSTDNVTAPLCPKQLGVCAGSRQICAGQVGLLACNIGNYGANYEVAETKCDKLDNDCDGLTDETDLDGDRHKPISCGGDDCDDTDRLSFPGNAEICGDAADNDCNGIDDDRDLDGDGWIAVQCGGEDCDDASDVANPTGTEVCGDAKDNDCDGTVDNKDTDFDTFTDRNCGGLDCNDARADVRPGMAEVCDTLDNNCNGQTDEKDADADGFRDINCGGTDCDDSRPLVNPDGIEVCGNPQDEDCSGVLNDRDLDNDGVIASTCSAAGTDCDDFDASVFPASLEVWDTKDNDCDLNEDEGVVPTGAVIVTELQIDPATPGDALGEYFEITNVSGQPVNIGGWQFWDCGSAASNCTTPVPSVSDLFIIGATYILDPGEVMTLCITNDPATNGGFACNFEYGSDMTLANGGDELIITQGNVEIDRVIWAASAAGTARALRPEHYTGTGNDTNGNWCFASNTAPFQIGTSTNYGTPGVINPGDCGATPPPGVAMIVPADGIATGGQTVTIYGSGFVVGATTFNGGTFCTSVTVDASLRKATCTTALHAQGAVGVSATVNGTTTGTALGSAFTFTVAGNGPFTGATLGSPVSYTVPAGDVGPVLKGVFDPGNVANVRAEVGYGPNTTDPSVNPSWKWFPAVLLSGGGALTYGRSLVIPLPAATYSYGFRASVDGITWRYTNRGSAVVTQ